MTRRYNQDKESGSNHQIGAFSLDHGGNKILDVTEGTFPHRKMPDPSAILTRGNNNLYRMGGSVMSVLRK